VAIKAIYHLRNVVFNSSARGIINGRKLPERKNMIIDVTINGRKLPERKNMRIEVEELNKVLPNFRGGGNCSNIKLDIVLLPHQAEKLFYELWEGYEGGIFEKWIEAEGYQLIKKDRASELNTTNGITDPDLQSVVKIGEAPTS